MNAGTCRPTVNDKRNQNNLLIMLFIILFIVTNFYWNKLKYGDSKNIFTKQ